MSALEWHFENGVYNALEYQAGLTAGDVDVDQEYFDPMWQEYDFKKDSETLSKKYGSGVRRRKASRHAFRRSKHPWSNKRSKTDDGILTA
jgi:hypothetical protein